MTRWCVGPCRRLLSVVAFDPGWEKCNRCRRNSSGVTERALAAFAQHMSLPWGRRGGLRVRRRTAA